MNWRSVLAAVVIVAAASPVCSFARAVDAFAEPGERSVAVDVHGVTHSERLPAGTLPTWFKDCIRPIGPDYPYSARASGQTGVGRFRLRLDLKTGGVTQVTVIKSTGFQILDAAALAALRKWRWKPGKWQQVDIRVVFKLEPSPHRPPPGAVRLPRA